MSVHEYLKGNDHLARQDHFYSHRTHLDHDRVKAGDFSLTLKDPCFRDSGTYICTVHKNRAIYTQQVVRLRVKEFPRHGVISSPGAHLLRGAAGEVPSAQGFDSLLQGAVQGGLSTGLRVQEQQPGHGLDEDLLPQADVPGQLGPDHTCRSRDSPGSTTTTSTTASQ
ncbi:hypothetical protein FQN60_009158, partial [Etheostoma spectabile]